MIVHVRRCESGAGLALPAYATAGAVGLDLMAADAGWVRAGEQIMFSTGFAFEIPAGFEGQVRSRSGLAFNRYVYVFPGTIDSDYRGEIKVQIINHGTDPFEVRRGDRIAQLVIAPVVRAVLKMSPQLAQSERGSGGFGSTGA